MTPPFCRTSNWTSSICCLLRESVKTRKLTESNISLVLFMTVQVVFLNNNYSARQRDNNSDKICHQIGSVQYCFHLQPSIMQKHQQWLDNRNYQFHLNNLTKIQMQLRKAHVQSAANLKRHRDQPGHSRDNSIHHRNQSNLEQDSPRGKRTMLLTSTEKQKLWTNFLLGKRIIETSPVINTRKHEDEYNKHLKVLELRTHRKRDLMLSTSQRQAKLKQFSESTNRMNNCFRIHMSCNSRKIITLTIAKVEFTRMRPSIGDMTVKLHLQGRRSLQASEIVNFINVPEHEFYFRYPAQSKKNPPGMRLIFSLFEVKGLEERHIGDLLLDRENLCEGVSKCSGELIKSGKTIGIIDYSVGISKKTPLTTHP